MHTSDVKMRDEVDPPRYSSESVNPFLDIKADLLDGTAASSEDQAVRYMSIQDKMIISIDVGNSFCKFSDYLVGVFHED